ncbi:hypothetical protein [uncultured Lamprocystis sp.]|uniref:hypothetical protein n=1 Tax=uncultured Lamprocystis sp. TaxID=543132 RepID=UPI0034483179
MTGQPERKILIIAGPNGAGKTTFAEKFLPTEAACPTFINAEIALQRAALADRFQDLFKDSQTLSGAATLTDTEIASEIDAVRDGRFGQVPGTSQCIR